MVNDKESDKKISVKSEEKKAFPEQLQTYWISRSDVAPQSQQTQPVKKKQRAVFSMWRIFSDYSKRSTIHGVFYLGEKHRHWAERFAWLIIFTTSISLCSLLIYQIYSQWFKTPVIISFSSEAMSISDIPFPSFTICGENKLRDDKFNYSRIYYQLHQNGDFFSLNISENEVQKLHAISNICDPPTQLKEYVQFKKLQLDQNILPHLEHMVPDLFRNTLLCQLDAESGVPCTEIFTKTLTDSGLCYTFNHLPTEEIFYEDKLADNFPKVKPFQPVLHNIVENLSFPYRIQNSGYGFKMLIVFTQKVSTQSCRMHIEQLLLGEGIKVHIHAGGDVPQMKRYFHTVPFDHIVHMTVRPNIITTDENLIANYNKNQRKCVAQHENDLVFFRKYTQSNCHLEVFVLKAIEKCGCALFWMPRFNDTQICSFLTEFQCISIVKRVTDNIILKNSCLPSCNSITYNFDASISKLEIEYPQLPDKKIVFFVSFKDEQYFSLRRSELYTRNDFMAACGGILSLFMGFSFLSIIEILYSITLRPFFDFRNRRPKNQSENNDGQVNNMEKPAPGWTTKA